MRYSYEFKIKCIELYRQGIWPETPKGVNTKMFHKEIWKWSKIEDECGPAALRHQNRNKLWTAEERFELVAQILAGKSITQVAISNGISDGQLYQWVRKYKTLGYNGLVNMTPGRKSKESQMKKKSSPSPLTETEREELVRLRAENEYIKAEIEVIKKEIALREEKEAARLKAKKQRLSKNSVNRDTN